MTNAEKRGADHLADPAVSMPINWESQPASPGAALLALQPELARHYSCPELDHQLAVVGRWLLKTAQEAERGTL